MDLEPVKNFFHFFQYFIITTLIFNEIKDQTKLCWHLLHRITAGWLHVIEIEKSEETYTVTYKVK